jgi:hypothetical protein
LRPGTVTGSLGSDGERFWTLEHLGSNVTADVSILASARHRECAMTDRANEIPELDDEKDIANDEGMDDEEWEEGDETEEEESSDDQT